SQFPLGKVDRRGCGPLVRKFSFDGQLLWLRTGIGGALAVGDGKVFTSRDTYTADGDFLGRRSLDGLVIAPKGLAYYDGALYLCSLDPYGGDRGGPPQLAVLKTDLDGNVEWQVDYPKSEQRMVCAVDATSDGVYVTAQLSFRSLGTFTPNGNQRYRPGLTVRRWDASGAATATWDFPALSGPWDPFTHQEYEDLPYSISVLEGAVYLAGHDAGADTGFVARVSGETLLSPSVVGLDDGKRLAVLEHQYGAGAVTAIVQAADGTGGSGRVAFSDGLRPVDFFAVHDLGGDGREDLGVLSRRPALLEVVDSQGGITPAVLPIDADFEPVAAASVANGPATILAVLMKHRTKGYTRVEEFDALSGESLRTIPFNPNFLPLDVMALGNGATRRYAVLMLDPAPGGAHKIEIRDTVGNPAVNAWLGSRLTPVQALAYTDHAGAERIAVLRRNAELDWQDIVVADPDGGDVLHSIAFTGQTLPAAFAWSGDVQGDLSPQFTVAGRDATGSARAETREFVSGALLHNVFLGAETPIQDLVYLGADSGLPTPSLGLLVPINSGPYQPHDEPYSLLVTHHRFGLVLIDLLTGTTTGELIFPADDVSVYAPAGNAVIGDFVWHDQNGNGIQDAAEPGLAGVKVKLRDCSSPARYQQTTFSDASGYYEFRVFEDAGFIVEFLPPEGAAYTLFQAGSDTALDSDAGAGGFSPCIELQGGPLSRPDVDAGFVLP
ncbi:MAG TPA: SdrD B-like domain-containing protein, partial [Woeseiaceae bacterium]|nr:SdrD B-like domain-containing protein [Woeseiaceae bacterium]